MKIYSIFVFAGAVIIYSNSLIDISEQYSQKRASNSIVISKVLSPILDRGGRDFSHQKDEKGKSFKHPKKKEESGLNTYGIIFENITKCFRIEKFDRFDQITPEHVTDSEKFILPHLKWGPTNQVFGMFESMQFALDTNRTLVIPPIFRHSTDPM